MDDKDIKIDLSNIDMMLDRLANKMENGIQLDLDYDYSSMGHAGTISQAASASTWPYPYVSTNTGTYTLTTGTGTGNISPGLTFSDTWRLPEQALHVRGDAEFDGDVKLKGKSLSETLNKIEERLAILKPNEKLEEKWEELRELRNRYVELEKEIIEKEKMWDTLKK